MKCEQSKFIYNTQIMLETVFLLHILLKEQITTDCRENIQQKALKNKQEKDAASTQLTVATHTNIDQPLV